jgi:RNA polymerase sigma-70 factor (ECF subfamily)
METHLERVWNLVWRVLRHQEDTEDVVQEVFLTAWKSLPGFRGDAHLSTWLQKIAVSRALNHRARASERMRRASVPLEDPMEDDARTRPLRRLEEGELRQRLSDCLRKLPEPWRAVLALRQTETSSYEQIAAALEVAVGTVRSRLARARLALRDCVEGRT